MSQFTGSKMNFVLDPDIWGPHFWFVLHTMAMTYPHHPNDVTKKKNITISSRICLFFYQLKPLEPILVNYWINIL